MANSENEIQEITTLTLLQFYAEWCHPCKMVMPIVASIKGKQYDWLDIHQIDVDHHREIAGEYQIRSVPTFVVLKNNKEVWRSSGILSARALMEELSLLK